MREMVDEILIRFLAAVSAADQDEDQVGYKPIERKKNVGGLLLVASEKIVSRSIQQQIESASNDHCLPDDPHNELESRTIPIWLALLICVVYVCGCSCLFLIWETKWTFFTSLYFFCISLSTIGLGDIVPDKPHMFIVMFVLVILGLSIVSMFISVVQIKMEEWLSYMIKKIAVSIK